MSRNVLLRHWQTRPINRPVAMLLNSVRQLDRGRKVRSQQILTPPVKPAIWLLTTPAMDVGVEQPGTVLVRKYLVKFNGLQVGGKGDPTCLPSRFRNRA